MGEGIYDRALAPVTEYAFGSFGFDKLLSSNTVGNARSARSKEKSDATFLRREAARCVAPSYTEREIYELSKATLHALKRDGRNS